MYIFRLLFFVLTGSLTLSANLFAKDQINWADSVLGTFEKDQSRNYGNIGKYADTILQLYSGKEDCNYIRVLIYKNNDQCRNLKYKEALLSLTLALHKFQNGTLGCDELLAEIYYGFGNLYNMLSEPAKAKSYLLKGIESWNKTKKQKDILIKLYNMLGNQYATLDSQLYYYQLSYKYALEARDVVRQEHALSSIGTAYAVADKFGPANMYLRKALRLALARNSFATLSSLYNNLAGLSQNKQQILMYVDSAIYYAKLSGDLEDYQTGRQNRALLYYQNGDFEKGYEELWESLVLKDSLYNQNKIQAFAEMEQKYEAAKKNSDIQLLKREKEIERMRASRNLGINFGLGGALLGIIFVALAFYKQNKKKQKLNAQLTIEKQKSDDLLLNILPGEIADELKHKGSTKAKQFDEVTVMFTDFIDFTQVSEKLSPNELVSEIDTCFKAFDEIIERNGLEKIKTIGDAYMAVSGLPHQDANHAIKATQAALEICQWMEKRKAGEGKFELRIGLSSGPVVAGIVGSKKFQYDIWGDTVNTASRMESSGEEGKVNISGSTYELVKEKFNCTHRGKIIAKGKGEIDMYFVS